MVNLHQKLVLSLKRHFGFSRFRPGQEPVLRELLYGHDVLAILPTGAGKTLIYQLYGFLQSHLVIIVSPLLSLMQDQIGRMQSLGIKNSVALNSLLDIKQRSLILRHLNRYRYLYISPEMISQPAILKYLRRVKVGLFVIDEAHCVSQWGPDFRPEYLSLGSVIKRLGSPRVLMLTATASKAIRRDIISKLGLTGQNVKQLVYSVNRPNIFLAVRKFSEVSQKDRFLLRLLRYLKTPGIIYFSSRKLANQAAGIIQRACRVRTEAYHSGLSSAARYRIQHQFMTNQIGIICATSAFGMGIDKTDVRFVIHYHLPSDLNTYLQEIGRAGRDGKQSLALILYAEHDEQLPAALLASGLPSQNLVNRFFFNPARFAKYRHLVPQIRVTAYYYEHGSSLVRTLQLFRARRRQRQRDLEQMMHYVNCRGCRRRYVLRCFGERQLPVHGKRCCDFKNPVGLKFLGLETSHRRPIGRSRLAWRPILDRLFNR